MLFYLGTLVAALATYLALRAKVQIDVDETPSRRRRGVGVISRVRSFLPL